MGQDIYGALHADHERLQSMLAGIVDGRGGSLDQRFADLQITYHAHERAEEKTFYEPLLRPGTTRERVLEVMAEHHVADMVMDELAAQPDVREEHWHAEALVLRELIEHHIAEEERQLFPLARQAMDEDWAAQARRTFEQAKADIARRGTR